MAYTALYRKYRPVSFSDVYGREVIVQILINSIKNNKISHAYLFSGTRGTGKTTLARIFAKAVNCQNFTDDVCGTCDMCIALNNNDVDIVEIDAASNNGVDEIREIRNNTKLMPSVAKYKVYIIDEVHMLSTGAFNALLKTLEEPPAHVIFILATTEMNKIPLTILSRCIRFDFTKFSVSKLKERLSFICEKENFNVSDEVLNLIAELSDGGMRDAINLLDQITSLNLDDITVDDVYRVSGTISSDSIYNLYNAAINSDVKFALEIINKMYEEGKNFIDIVNKMITFLHDYKLNEIDSSFFGDKYSQLLSSIYISTDACSKILSLLYELNTQLKNSINQKVVFEIHYLMMIEIFSKKINGNNKGVTPIKLDTKSNNEEQKIESIASEKSFDFNKIMNVRLNNVLATADKSILNKYIQMSDSINDYISNKKYMKCANILLNAKLVAAGDKRILFTVSDDASLLTFYNNLKELQQFLKIIFDEECAISALTENAWLEIKKEYVKNIKNGVKYELMEENYSYDEEVISTSKVESSALEVFGEDSVDII